MTDPTLEAMPSGDVAAALAAGAAAATLHQIDDTAWATIIPDGWTLQQLDAQPLAVRPRRRTGIVNHRTVQSFMDYVEAHLDPNATTIWVDERLITAVLNDHDIDAAGWGDHRALLGLTHTPEWEHWTSLDNRLISQVEFAEHIENGLREIVEPEAAQMLEIAQSFHAATSAQFRTAKRLTDGRVQVQYDEEIKASAGTAGQLDIPAEFKLAISPYEGEQRYAVTARLRYRIGGGSLKIGYKLDRPHEVEKDARGGIATRLAEKFDFVYVGSPRHLAGSVA